MHASRDATAAERAGPNSLPKSVVYSAAPLCTIDTNELTASRFLLPASRRLAYRDSSGHVNLNLCQQSIGEYDEALGDTEADKHKLIAWERHARRAISARPADELTTLDEMIADQEEKERMESEALAALPISLAKPRRGVQNVPADETIVVLHSSPHKHEDEDAEERVPVTVTMKRRLFAAPLPGDEPTPDILYLRTLEGREKTSRRRSPTLSFSDDEDVYEVERILKEDEATGRFLIRWEGFGPESDTWEPEENVAAPLVEAFRERQRLVRSNAGDDFAAGRAKMLWCASCSEHQPADCFSANQRRVGPASRVCLNHHYRTGGASLRGSPFASPIKATSSKRHRDDNEQSPLPPPPPMRAAARSVARQLSVRHADMEVSRCRLYGLPGAH